MHSFFEWFQVAGQPDQPWLILGKGPSFARLKDFDIGSYFTMSLNHAVREQPVTIAHIIDRDVVDDCGEAILQNARFLVMPWIPHVKNRPGRHDLGELAQTHPILNQMDREGRLLWYNSSRAWRRRGDSPVVRVKFFSAVAALNLLAQAGARTVRSLGVDGGAAYSEAFSDLNEKTLLANRRSSFDRQFEEIARTLHRTGIDYAPMDVASPIKIFVGATDAEILPVRVLEYSIRKRASMSVQVAPLNRSGITIPLPKDAASRPRTPFSFQRFLIPALTGYRGRAIYLDSDMLVFKDIRALWTMPFRGADLLAPQTIQASTGRPQFSVMVLNCDTLDWDIQAIVRLLDERRLSYDQLVYQMALAKSVRMEIGAEWNALEHFSARDTALLHFTDMSMQPWVARDNPLGYLWVRELFEAVETGFLSLEFVAQQVGSGHVRPSLLYQLEKRIDDSLLLPKRAIRLDGEFVPPYQSLSSRGVGWPSAARRLRAWLRRYCQNDRTERLQRLFYDWLYR